MDDGDRRTNETIAKACGWSAINFGGDTLWTQSTGRYVEIGETTCTPPDYMADPARLPEMWALCRARGWRWQMVQARDTGYFGWVHMAGESWHEHDTDPQRAFARALAAALESEEGG